MTMMILPLFLVFCTAALVGYSVVPFVYNKTMAVSHKRAVTLSSRLDRVMSRKQINKLTQLYMLAPFVMAALLYFLFPENIRLIGLFFGAIGGIVFPTAYTKVLTAKNRAKFNNQLIDALMIMSSSFRGGLSLVQALEAVVEEMGDPIAQEFATVLGENKMGVSLDEALNHLYNRMPSPAMQQMITAILLARETGGNLPAIFTRIVGVIREYRRVQQQIDTLTIQGKIQGVVMSFLPIAFFGIIYSTNPHFFDHMFTSEMGRVILTYAICSEIIGAFLIWKISSIKDF